MNTLAVRDQENFVHNQQTAAAAKPLNQGVRGLAPKTPGNNGFKNIVNAHKTIRGQKGDENVAPAAKTAKALKTSFVTPTAQRDRAPLGAKTTNIKAKAFQTPAPLTIGNGFKTQQRNSSARKAKLKIHKPEVVPVESQLQLEDDDEEPEIEYCPPKIKELPDYPDDPLVLAQLPPDAFRIRPFQSWSAEYRNRDVEPVDDKILEAKFRKEDEEFDRQQAEESARFFDAIGQKYRQPDSAIFKPSDRLPKPTPTKKVREPSKTTSNLSATSAAAALSGKPLPRFARPTASTAAKIGAPSSTTSPSASPRIAAASRSSLGYAAGRKASSLMKQKRQPQLEQKSPNTQPHVRAWNVVSSRAGPTDGGMTPPWLSVYREEESDDDVASLFGAKDGDLFAAADEYINGLAGSNHQLDISDFIEQ